MAAKFGAGVLSGKKRYVLKLDGFDRVETSVDETIQLPDGRTILIEIDSGNMAKLLAGQYALLNGLCGADRTKTLFLVVQYYVERKNGCHKPYAAHRTLKNLNAIQSFDKSKEWLPYHAIHMENLIKLIAKVDSITTLIDHLWPKKSAPQSLLKRASSTAHIIVPRRT